MSIVIVVSILVLELPLESKCYSYNGRCLFLVMLNLGSEHQPCRRIYCSCTLMVVRVDIIVSINYKFLLYTFFQPREPIFGRKDRLEFAHIWNKSVDKTFGPLIESLSSRGW